MIRNIATDFLEDLGYSIEVFSNGNDAIKYYKHEWKKIDLVILDMLMPEMGGRETFNAMYSLNPNIKVLLASGFSLTEETKDILDTGCAKFIQKPFSEAELSNAVSNAMKPGVSM